MIEKTRNFSRPSPPPQPSLLFLFSFLKSVGKELSAQPTDRWPTGSRGFILTVTTSRPARNAAGLHVGGHVPGSAPLKGGKVQVTLIVLLREGEGRYSVSTGTGRARIVVWEIFMVRPSVLRVVRLRYNVRLLSRTRRVSVFVGNAARVRVHLSV